MFEQEAREHLIQSLTALVLGFNKTADFINAEARRQWIAANEWNRAVGRAIEPKPATYPGAKLEFDKDNYPIIAWDTPITLDVELPALPALPAPGNFSLGPRFAPGKYHVGPGDTVPDGELRSATGMRLKKVIVQTPFGPSAWYEEVNL